MLISGVLIGCLVVAWPKIVLELFVDDFLDGDIGLEAGVLSSLSSLLLLQDGGVGGRWKPEPGSTLIFNLGIRWVVSNVFPDVVVIKKLACLNTS